MKSHISGALLSKSAQVFLLCCDLKNFSSVASALGITQSAVSKIIQKFEKDVGFELFIRNSRPLTLTAEARLLHRHLRGIKGEISRSLSTLQSKNYIKPILRIGILESLHLELGVELIERMASSLSQITLLAVSANVLMQWLVERKLDLIITSNTTTEAPHLFRRRLFREPSILMLPKKFELDENGPWTWQKLALCGLPLVRYWSETSAGEVNELFMKTNSIRFPERISVNTNSMMVKLISRGAGWGFSRPTTVLENIHMLHQILVRPMQEPVFSRDVFLMGREQEFLLEADLVQEISTHYLQTSLIPDIIKFAPWLKDKFVLD